MRPAIAFCLAAALCCVLACSRADEAAEPAAAPEPGPASPESAAGSAASSAPAVYAGHDYVCPDGKTVNAKLDDGNALFTADGKTITLVFAEGSYDARYEGEGTTFVAMGNEAMIVREGSPPQTCKAK